MEDIKNTLYREILLIIKKIIKSRSKSMYNAYVYQLSTLYNLCDNLGFKDYPDIDNYSNKSYDIADFDYTYKILNNVLNNKNYYENLANSYKTINFDKYLVLQSQMYFKYINILDSSRYVEQFLKDYDYKLYDYFTKVVDDGKILFCNEIYLDGNIENWTTGYTVYAGQDILPYIIMRNFNNICDASTMVHELAHSYDMHTINHRDNLKKYEICLDEVFPHYLQFLFMEYLKKCRVNVDDINSLYLDVNYVCVDSIKSLHNSFENEEYDDIDVNLSYGMGILYAYEFVDRYFKNEEATKKEMYNFLNDLKNYNTIEILDKYKLNDSKKIRSLIINHLN